MLQISDHTLQHKKPLIAAVVVLYFPDHDVLYKLLISISDQVDQLILIDNGGSEDVLKCGKISGINFRYIKLGKNLGLGYALNTGFSAAQEYGVEYVVTFDQDSAPPPSLLADLLKSHLMLSESGVNCAAVSPVFFDRREGVKSYFPFYREYASRIEALRADICSDHLVETDVLITSGMMVRMAAWADGLEYDAGLFVDYTDTEWCFRARRHGYHLFGNLSVEMGHAPSDAPPARIWGLSFFRYSPLRRYYYYRNTILFCKKDYVSFAWKKRLFTGLLIRFVVNLLIDKNKLKSFRMMSKGVLAGLYGRSGEYRG